MEAELLFKFHSITTIEHLKWVIDSINNNQIYFPNYKELNDPLECSGYVIEVSGYAGKNLIKNADEEDPVLRHERDKYKILSLSEDCFSPSMWAHYTQAYKGICIGYWRQDVFSLAQKIEYLSQPKLALSTNENGYIPDDNIDYEVLKSFFYKHHDWSSEKEWRIVQKTTNEFLKYKPSSLACIVFGEGLYEEIRNILRKQCNLQVPMFYTKTSYRTFGISFLPDFYEIEYDGSEPPYIKTIEDLIKNIRSPKK